MSPQLLVLLVLLTVYTVFGHNVRLRRSPLSSEKCLSHDDCPLKCRPYCDCQVDHRNCSDQTGHCIGGIPCNSDEECRKKCDHDHNYRCFEGVCS
ncbi:hypothetical protein AAVH_41368 [Aphelenchoides avenae]|nr:hypothetical protein AAVH_41368 [Aphelenchus avenae]